jgi:hypothetical protein
MTSSDTAASEGGEVSREGPVSAGEREAEQAQLTALAITLNAKRATGRIATDGLPEASRDGTHPGRSLAC